MVSKSDIRQHFLSIPKSQDNIVNFCKEEYENQARLRGNLFVTNYLNDLVRQVCQTLGISNSTRIKIQNSLFHLIVSYRIRAGMQSNKAPIFHPEKHLKLIAHLWTKKGSIEKTFAYKSTAVQALICLHSFRRWIDATRIRWEHCNRIVNNGRVFLKFTLAASKTNSKGKRDEFITLQENGNKLCPVKILCQYWQIRGCPKSGFVLPCIHKNKSFVYNGLFETWDAYICLGHKKSKSERKVACLGEMNGITSFGYYSRAANEQGWPTLPHKHSFRRAGIIIANKLKMPRERITEYFGWKHDSEMISLYTNNELATTNQSLAWKFSDALKNNLACLNDISFTE